MNKVGITSQTKFPYLLTALGVGLMAATEVYGYVRTMMIRAMFQAGAGSGFAGERRFSGGVGFGGPNILTIIAIVVAVAGVVWLGLALRKSPKPS